MIFGDGPVAMTSALAATALGFDVHLIRMAPKPAEPKRKDPRAWALTPSSLMFLEALGLKADVKSPVATMEVWHADHTGTPLPGQLHFSGTLASPLTSIVPNQNLRADLEGLLQDAAISQEFLGADEVRPNPLVLKGKAQTLCLICDPAWAAALPLDVQPRRSAWPYDQVALTAPVQLAEPHKHVARQVFLPSGPLALLPLPNPRAASLIWSLTKAKLSAALAEPNLAQTISQLTGQSLNLNKSDLAHFPLSASHASTYGGPGFVILGDAAHRIHPLAGQGLNLGFADVGALFDVLVQARSVGTDLSSPFILEGFERRRRPQNEMMRAATDQLKSVFSVEAGPLRFVRSLGLNLFNASPLKSKVQDLMTDDAPLCQALLSI